jgi:hypothetical protein
MIKKIALVTLILMLAMGCAVAEEDGLSAESTNGGYIVTPAKFTEDPFQILRVSDTVIQGETNWHTKSVSTYMTTLNVNLYWGNPSNSLQLTIYTPDGYTLGPYYDNADGSVNGRINLAISNPNGIAKGTWTYRVYGYSVSGVQSYTI